MSPHASSTTEASSQTAAVATTTFPLANACMQLSDKISIVFGNAQLAVLFSSGGGPVDAPLRLALITLLQFAENLSDRRAAKVARGHIDCRLYRGSRHS